MIVICHHGILGQKWGVRRYQYADGTLTPLGRRRKYGSESLVNTTIDQLKKEASTILRGKMDTDKILAKNLNLSRIQTSGDMDKFAFYATYRAEDVNKYIGLYGNDLRWRAEKKAKNAEKKAEQTGDSVDKDAAVKARKNADNLNVYRLNIKTIKKLRLPSDENAADITAQLLDDEEFKRNVIASVQDSKEKMKRPSQQLLFAQASKALGKKNSDLSPSDKVNVYKAFNLTLTNHTKQEIAAQNRFYSELKKKGYNALLDYNDKEYSSYHAKSPVIVFDLDAVKLSSVSSLDPKNINLLYRKYNLERLMKEIPEQTISTVPRSASVALQYCNDYVMKKVVS